MVKLYKKDEERIAEVEKYEAGRRFLRRKCKRPGTRRLYAMGALLFSGFLKKPIDDIVAEYQRDAKENLYAAYDKWEMIFEDFGDYLKENHPKGTTASTYFSGAVGLINANVPQSAEIHPKGPEAHPRSIPPITIEDLTTIRNIADIREGAFIDVLKDTGMSRADAVTLTYGQVKKAVENPNIQFHKIDVYRGKENIEYETWLGPNANESLRLLFKVRRQSGEEITDNTPIFDAEAKALDPQSLSAIFLRLKQKTGITISPHRIRKFFETYITSGGAHPIVAKYWMGHKIKGGRGDIEARYIIPPEDVQREIYQKAYSKIDLRPTISEEERRIQSIIDNARLIGIPDNQIEALLKERGKTWRNATELTMRMRAYTEKTEPNGGDCDERFEEIDEGNLLQYLRNGWRIVHNLQNGKVIISKG